MKDDGKCVRGLPSVSTASDPHSPSLVICSYCSVLYLSLLKSPCDRSPAVFPSGSCSRLRIPYSVSRSSCSALRCLCSVLRRLFSGPLFVAIRVSFLRVRVSLAGVYLVPCGAAREGRASSSLPNPFECLLNR